MHVKPHNGRRTNESGELLQPTTAKYKEKKHEDANTMVEHAQTLSLAIIWEICTAGRKGAT